MKLPGISTKSLLNLIKAWSFSITNHHTIGTHPLWVFLSVHSTPRHHGESFFGGRTNIGQLYYRAKETEQIKYVDPTSVYLFINKMCQYLMAHSEVITSDFKDLGEYFGIAKVKYCNHKDCITPCYPTDRMEIKVRKRAKIRNRYNQAPHLNQDTNAKVTTS